MLTVLVPTKNRSPFLLRLLSYYSNQKFNHRLLIADSSDPAQASENKRALDALGEKFDLEYQSYDGSLGFLEKVNAALDTIETPYTVIGADDDFYITTALSRAVEFLQAHADYTLVHGDHLVVSLMAGETWGQLTGVWRYERRTIEAPTGVERLTDHFLDYSPTWYSVHRTKQLRDNLAEVVKLELDLLFGELLPSGLSLIEGKVKKLSGLYMVRQESMIKEYETVDLFDWITGPTWPEQYERFQHSLAGVLAAQDQMGLDEARARLKQIFWAYLTKQLGKLWQSKYSYQDAGERSRWKQVVRRLPGMRRFREMLRHLNKRENDETSLATLLRPSSPYHADFLPIYRALTTTLAGETRITSS